MAAFPYNHHPFLFDPLFFPNPDSKMSDFSEEPNTTPSFFQFHQPHPDISAAVSFHESSCLEHNNNNNSTPQVGLSNMTNKHSTDSSSVVLDKLESGEQVTQKRKHSHGSSLNSAQSQDTREVKVKKQKKMNNGGMKKGRAGEKKKVISEEAPSGYIHVRARRGQATDSHSLAERVRREKISVRMKLLQALVPGCDKVTGKALMLDEIINYVQSLQNQVEFLSLKLASVNPMFYDFGMDLDTFMVRPERLSSMESPLPNVQQCSPTHPTAFSDTTNTFTTANSYPLLDNSASLLFQQGQMQNILSQNNGQVLWDVDGQREKITSQSGFPNLCSFH